MSQSLNSIINRINTRIADDNISEKKWIVAYDNNRFFLNNGQVIATIHELCDGINSMNDEQYTFHVNADNNDFANWVEFVLHEENVAATLRKAKDRKDAYKKLKKILNT